MDKNFAVIQKTIITVGAFDGVHRGHQEILNRLQVLAIEKSAEPMVITFWPHPSHVIGKHSLKLINTLQEKRWLIESFGIIKINILPFTYDFSKMNSLTFIKEYLIEKFNMKYFLLGYNHHFGNDREGDINIIKNYGEELGFEVEKVGPVEINGEKISSTKIRQALTEGRIDEANSYLGYQYFLSGTVGRGQMIGRTIGFPTANIQIEEECKLLPKEGVYAVKAEVNGNLYNGMLNIGYRPTVNSNINLKTIEVHLLDFNKDIYNETIKVYFVSRIRDEIKFSGVENLKLQLHKDKTQIEKLFG